MEKLEASVLHTVFRNTENGYTVLSVRNGRDETTVVGTLPELAAGEQVLLTGEWTEHRNYGRQFRCETCEIKAPTTLQGIERYLASGLIRGVKTSTAAQIVNHFGEETLTVLSEHPERLTEIPGIGKVRCAMIAESFQAQQAARETMVFLQTYRISQALANRISERYGNQTREIIRQNPYQLCNDLEGVGFKTADRIAMSIGIPPDDVNRIRQALRYLLQEAAAGAGHLYLPEKELIAAARDLLEVDPALCTNQLSALLISGRLQAETAQDGRRIFLPPYRRAEQEVALRLRQLLLSSSPASAKDAPRAVDRFERRNSISFSATQRQAILQALTSGVFVITGGPGTGKTTIINCILSLLSAAGVETQLCAPTGRAARRMTEATGAESQTIHRLLEYSGEKEGTFQRNEENPLNADCLIVDEASMIDLPLMRALLRAVDPGTRLILVGDADQLPSVGPGNVLGDILDSGEIPCIRLTDIFRQSETSRIVLNAHRINHGEMPLLNEKNTDFFFERKDSMMDAASAVTALITSRLPAYFRFPPAEAAARSARFIQVLTPTRKGECGVSALNSRLQAMMNPSRAGVPELTWGDSVFRLGDKVIQTRNDYSIPWMRKTPHGDETGEGIFNGDVGFVSAVSQEDASLTVIFDEEREVCYESAALENLELAYCLSVHKAQGSEFPVVVMPVVSGPSLLLTRNLLYTALTRARQMVVLVGSEAIIRRMVENDTITRRYTCLAERLRETATLDA